MCKVYYETIMLNLTPAYDFNVSYQKVLEGLPFRGTVMLRLE